MASTVDLSVLENVVELARYELHDRDPDDIPNKLSAAAAATGKRIPPPHQRAILAHIEADDGFREAVKERLIEAGLDDPVAHAYLDDPGSATTAIDLAVAVRAQAALEAALEVEIAKTATASAKLAESKARLAGVKRDAERDLAERAEADKRARSSLEAKAKEASDRADSASVVVRNLEDDLIAKSSEISELEAKIAMLNEKLMRRRASSAPRSDVLRSERSDDPVEIARDLDSQERRLRTYRQAHLTQAAHDGARPELTVPKGISSADSVAIDAIVSQRPQRVIIDGYNVAGLASPENFSTRPARDDVIHRAAKLVRETDAKVVVVFDARQSSEGSTTFTSETGVEVVFEGDTIADDTIAALAGSDDDRCVVITNDREIHNRVRRTNCVSIFSSAFVSWTEHLNR